MSDTVIKVTNLSKKYTLAHQSQERYTCLRDVIARGAATVGRKILSPSSRSPRRSSEEFFALNNVSLEIRRGDRVGIIGRNGAGKSTLLKILSRITDPTSGRIEITGRIASLLEVGTGFHQELTGRENIFFNGAILGMTRGEIQRKFAEIVAFAEVEKFLDTPVKHYSSGMYVRLAFAVAAHLEPEILVVDEVLAVGDAAFQKKCLGKMEDVSLHEGRTVVFVSHNMAAIQRLCTTGILLHKGRVVASGTPAEAISSYLAGIAGNLTQGPVKSGPAELEICTESADGERKNVFGIGEPVRFVLRLSADKPIRNAAIGIGILDAMGDRIVTHHTMFQHPAAWGFNKSVRIAVDWGECILCAGSYHFVVALYDGGQRIALWEDIGELQIAESDYFGTGRLPDPGFQGKIVAKAAWRFTEQPATP